MQQMHSVPVSHIDLVELPPKCPEKSRSAQKLSAIGYSVAPVPAVSRNTPWNTLKARGLGRSVDIAERAQAIGDIARERQERAAEGRRDLRVLRLQLGEQPFDDRRRGDHDLRRTVEAIRRHAPFRV